MQKIDLSELPLTQNYWSLEFVSNKIVNLMLTFDFLHTSVVTLGIYTLFFIILPTDHVLIFVCLFKSFYFSE